LRDQSVTSRHYELMTILHPEVAEDQIPGELERISGHIAGAGGAVTEMLRDSPWGRRRLAYPIRSGGRDVRDGFYTVFHFDMAPDQVDEMERDLKLNPRVIRYLVTTFTPKPLDPRAAEQAEIDAEAAAAEAYAASQARVAAQAPAVAAAPEPPPVEAAVPVVEAEPEESAEPVAEAEALAPAEDIVVETADAPDSDGEAPAAAAEGNGTPEEA
jgi:small subunit ribosomal protein S6